MDWQLAVKSATGFTRLLERLHLRVQTPTLSSSDMYWSCSVRSRRLRKLEYCREKSLLLTGKAAPENELLAPGVCCSGASLFVR